MTKQIVLEPNEETLIFYMAGLACDRLIDGQQGTVADLLTKITKTAENPLPPLPLSHHCPFCPIIGSKEGLIEHIFDKHRSNADGVLQMYGASHLSPIVRFTQLVDVGTVILEVVEKL
jgi:hypothetical protein